ncbi:MAG: hypothetical protein AVDCRST_MAG25-2426 [uncultured Rubrobacteraceae bacterium]|uniref:Uncharacterized protein n=1 Tax=uncultured Rubrobacteraceae bacterium TaxID=349277 RepID=A0A6J4RU79_9ACTN|nr:MAG: hypothetical protein AVDCRST_MAG25-2426 [uncultured Rubrobacteraceae bacterium]
MAAVLSGVMWWVQALLELAGVVGEEGESPWLTISFIVALLLLLAGMVGFHAVQKGSYGRLGRAGFYTVIAAGVVILIPNLVFLLSGSTIEVLFPIALLGLLVGFALYGVATWRAGVLPRWCGVVFVVAFPITTALGAYGNLWFGLVWLALGYVLWSRRGAAAEQPLRVR